MKIVILTSNCLIVPRLEIQTLIIGMHKDFMREVVIILGR